MKTVIAMFTVLAFSCSLAQVDGIEFDVEILRADSSGGFTPVEQAYPGDLIEYRIAVTNRGDIVYRPGTVVVTLPIGEDVCYVEGSATKSIDDLTTEFSTDGGTSFDETPTVSNGEPATPVDYDAIRWTFEIPFEPAHAELITYRVLVDCLDRPSPPAGRATSPRGTYSVDDFAFNRMRILDAGSGYAQVVGEVSSRSRFESVAFRVTLYDRSQQILGTDTFIVDAVGPTARVFDTLVRRIDAADVADYAFQVEWTR